MATHNVTTGSPLSRASGLALFQCSSLTDSVAQKKAEVKYPLAGGEPPSRRVELHYERLDDWLNIYCRFSESPLEKHQAHKKMLQAIPGRRFLTSLADSGQVVACGLGVLENGYFGLFDLITDPRRRNERYGTLLVSSLLRLAQDEGSAHAYLQVVNSNEPARRLYAKFGFQEVYTCWYRVLGTENADCRTATDQCAEFEANSDSVQSTAQEYH